MTDHSLGWVPDDLGRDDVGRDVHPGSDLVPYPGDIPSDVQYDVSFDVALDATPVHAVASLPVDPLPPLPVAVERRPVIPLQLRWGTLPATARRAAGRWRHITAYHAVRAPWYALVILRAAVVGAARTADRVAAWATMRDTDRLMRSAVDGADAATWLRLSKELRATRQVRGIAVAAGVGGLVAAWTLLLPALAGPWLALMCAGVVGVLARAGRAPGRPLIPPAVVTPRFRRLTADIVLRAYYAARLGSPDKPDQKIMFGSPMARDGDGSRVTVDLPYGKGLPDAVRALPQIASGLDVSTAQVFISRDESSVRRHVLWVADRDPLAVPAGPTPLLTKKPTDIWFPAPFGVNERGRPVSLSLMWNSILVGAQPRQGKTFTLRSLALYAALDPYVMISVFDGGGKPDWRPFALVADRCAFGLAPDVAGDPVDLLLFTLRDIKRDVQRRYVDLSKLPANLCPEGKLTRSLARDPDYGMPVRMLLLDEFQEYFNTGNSDADREIAELLVYLIRVAPAAGVILGTATQRPSGIGSSGEISRRFTDFRDNHIVRFSLRTGSWQVSDLVLGSGAYTEGLDSSTLLPQHKGVGILRGASDENPTVRTYLADAQHADTILNAARGHRQAAGTLTGQAAGVPVPGPARDVLADVRAAFQGEPGLHWAELAARLATALPDVYGQANAEVVSAQVRAFGVPSVDVKRHGQVLKGVRVDAIDAASQRAVGSATDATR
ncbi:Cell division protein FtsK/SpoIIIE [Frankia sp. AiPs1]|uniref:cell division protein FtsK n=1 Tax=Frankia sp. AiPa1 TaxID=573492 RepID=UPI00202B455A|nr:cell division protein FtsK [Frankia sp. AiPa1]